jgi:3-oxoadipate enol-lactonase
MGLRRMGKAARPWIDTQVRQKEMEKKLMIPFLNHKDSEEKRGICFLHGWLMSPDIWTASMKAVAQRGWRAVALPQPAHGQSLRPGGIFSMQEWADQTIEQLQALGLEQCLFFGQSMGSMLALEIASRHPDKVLGLGLTATTDQPATAEENNFTGSLMARIRDHWSIETADLASGVLIGKAFLQAHPTYLGEWTKVVSNYALKDDMPEIVRAVSERPDHTQVAAQLCVPAVVIHGEDDVAIPIETAVQVANRIPHARLVRVPAVGHCPPLEAPSAVAAEVIQLAEVGLYQ